MRRCLCVGGWDFRRPRGGLASLSTECGARPTERTKLRAAPRARPEMRTGCANTASWHHDPLRLRSARGGGRFRRDSDTTGSPLSPGASSRDRHGGGGDSPSGLVPLQTLRRWASPNADALSPRRRRQHVCAGERGESEPQRCSRRCARLTRRSGMVVVRYDGVLRARSPPIVLDPACGCLRGWPAGRRAPYAPGLPQGETRLKAVPWEAIWGGQLRMRGGLRAPRTHQADRGSGRPRERWPRW